MWTVSLDPACCTNPLSFFFTAFPLPASLPRTNQKSSCHLEFWKENQSEEWLPFAAWLFSQSQTGRSQSLRTPRRPQLSTPRGSRGSFVWRHHDVTARPWLGHVTPPEMQGWLFFLIWRLLQWGWPSTPRVSSVEGNTSLALYSSFSVQAATFYI